MSKTYDEWLKYYENIAIDILKCNELQNKYAELEKINKELDKSNIIIFEENDYLIKENRRLNNKEEQLIRRLEDLIIVGEQVENEWAVDICKMIINELKGSDK